MGDRGTPPMFGYCQLPPNPLYNCTVVISAYRPRWASSTSR